MAAFVMSYPFSMDAVNGRFSTVSTDTDTYKGQQISAFLKSRKNERALMPEFGITDPTFHKFDAGAFTSDFYDFYPKSITLKEVSLLKKGGVVTDARIEFG
jgi:hypothetical protein